MNTTTDDIGENATDGDPMADTDRKRMTRSDDRRIAGVAAGIGESFDVDPTWVRLGFVIALLFTLGTALLAYVVLWVVLPPAEGEAVMKGGRPEQPVLLVVIGLAAIVLLAGNLSEFGFGPVSGGVVLPLLLIGAGAVMLQQRGSVRSSARTAGPASPSTPTDPSPVSSSEPGTGLLLRSSVGEVGTDGSEGQPPPPTDDVGFDDGESKRPKKQKVSTPSVITPVVLSLGLVASAVGLALHLTDTASVNLTTMSSVWLMLIAGGLIVSAFRGRAGGLIPLGLLASLGLLAASVLDPIIDHGTGERDYVVRQVTELEAEYRLGVGDLLVDLSSLDLEGASHRVDIELTIGKLVVLLPAVPRLDLTIENDIGQIEFFDAGRAPVNGEGTNSGIGNDFRFVDPEGIGELIVNIDNRIGDVAVTRVRGN